MRKIYKWEEWFKERDFTIHRGRDYVCSQSGMAQQIRQAATRFGVRISLKDCGNSFTVIVKQEETCPA